MVHEASHLSFFRVSPAAHAPSWCAESMATCFEGFNWDGKAYKFTFVSECRLPFVRDAYAEFRKSVASGGTKALLEFFPDAAKLEADWVRFVTGL